MRIGVAIVLVTGCDRLFDIHQLPPASPVDAGVACSGMQAPLFCGDFEDQLPTFYVAGKPKQLPLLASQITAMVRPMAATGLNGVWFESQGGALFEYFSDPSRNVTTLDARFAINFAMMSPNPPITDVGLFNLTIGDCYVELELDQQTHALRIHGTCGTTPPVVMWMPQVPQNYFRVHFTLDVVQMTSTISVEGVAGVHLDFKGGPVTPGVPAIYFGVDGIGHDGFVVGFDDIAVTAM